MYSQLVVLRYVLVLLFAMVFLPSHAYAQLNEGTITSQDETTENVDVTLEQVLSMVEARVPTIAIAQSQVEEAILRRLAVRMERVPTFQIRAGLGPGPRDIDPDPNQEEFRYFQGITIAGQAGLTLPITTFGKIRVGTELAEAGIELKRVEEEAARLEAKYQAYRAYLGAQWFEDTIALLREAESRVKQAEDKILQALDEGDYTVRNDLRKIDILKADVLRMRHKVEETGFLARTGLGIIVPIDETTTLEPFSTTIDVETAPTFEEVFRAALDNRPELKKAEVGLKARQLELKLEKKKALPNVFFAAQGNITWTPTIDGSPSINEESNNFNEISGLLALGLQWKLNPGVHRARVRRLEQKVETIQIQKNAAQKSARLSVREAYIQTRNALEMVGAAERARDAAKAWLGQTAFQFEQGLEDFDEFQDPLEAYYKRSAAYLRAVLTYRLRLANLAVKCGSKSLRTWPGEQEAR